MTDPLEDFAVTYTMYRCHPDEARKQVVDGLKKGDTVLLQKYLFMKHLVFKGKEFGDTSGAYFWFETRTNSVTVDTADGPKMIYTGLDFGIHWRDENGEEGFLTLIPDLDHNLMPAADVPKVKITDFPIPKPTPPPIVDPIRNLKSKIPAGLK